MAALKIDYKNPGRLNPGAHNPRTYTASRFGKGVA
jgi:hypothetical protein